MSIEPEDLLEEALRSDLPSRDREARLRRKLVAAGIAVGNGIATTTAAASGSALGGASGAGLAAKVAGLSWGIKVGLAAAVAIPTVGLWLERAEPVAPPVAQAPLQQPAVAPNVTTPSRPGNALVTSPVAASEAEPREAAPKRLALRGDKPAKELAKEPTDDARTGDPSQSDVEAPVRALAPNPPVGSTLGEETRLLDRAFAELAAGQRGRAAELLAEHESRYPQGLLVKERERAKARISELSRGE